MKNETLNTGGPAFPVKGLEVDLDQETKGYCMPSTGMTLRDYFAAKAMQGLLSDSNMRGSADKFAAVAYSMADAMLDERDRGAA